MQTEIFEPAEKVEKIVIAKETDLLEITTAPNADFSDVNEPTAAPVYNEPVKKETRGRKKKSAPPVSFISDEDKNNIQGNPPEEIETEEETESFTATTLSAILPKGAAVQTLDSVMRNLMPFALNSIAGTKLKPSHFALTAQERSTIEPALDECLKTVKLKFDNPWTALAVIVGSIYVSKGISLIDINAIENGLENNDAPFGYNKDGSIKKDGRGRRKI